jgi:hypothetical protein
VEIPSKSRAATFGHSTSSSSEAARIGDNGAVNTGAVRLSGEAKLDEAESDGTAMLG